MDFDPARCAGNGLRMLGPVETAQLLGGASFPRLPLLGPFFIDPALARHLLDAATAAVDYVMNR